MPAEDPQAPPAAFKSFRIQILSNLLFVTASAAYLAAAILDYKDNEKLVALQGVSVSWIGLCIGAVCFIFVGLLDFYNTNLKLHIFLTLAGIFGTISAVTSDSNLKASLICNLLCAHLFLLESLNWIYNHMKKDLKQNDSRRTSLWMAEFADFLFFLGAGMDVVLSYYYLSQKKDTLIETQDLTTARAEIASASLWMIASLVTIFLSCKLGKQGFEGASNAGGSNVEIAASGSMA